MITKNVILMGMPGVGKGTVATILKDKGLLSHLSTGNIFRSEIKNKTELGMKVQEIVSTGGYVPDEITNAIVKNALDKMNEEGVKFILDGYPRTIEQAKYLSDTYGEDNFIVVELRVSRETVIERLSGRRMCSSCGASFHVMFKAPQVEGKCDECGSNLIQRKDDIPEAINHRLDIYNEQTQPLLDYYSSNGSLQVIEAYEAPEQVAEKVLNVITNN